MERTNVFLEFDLNEYSVLVALLVNRVWRQHTKWMRFEVIPEHIGLLLIEFPVARIVADRIDPQ